MPTDTKKMAANMSRTGMHQMLDGLRHARLGDEAARDERPQGDRVADVRRQIGEAERDADAGHDRRLRRGRSFTTDRISRGTVSSPTTISSNRKPLNRPTVITRSRAAEFASRRKRREDRDQAESRSSLRRSGCRTRCA